MWAIISSQIYAINPIADISGGLMFSQLTISVILPGHITEIAEITDTITDITEIASKIIY